MTVTYIQHVLNGGKFGAFLRLLFMWRGSVYKATGINLVIFISLYTMISLLYRYLLSQDEQYKLGRWSLLSVPPRPPHVQLRHPGAGADPA